MLRIPAVKESSEIIASDAPTASRWSGPFSLALTPRLLAASLMAASSLYLSAYIAIALLRMRYPLQLEWMESGLLTSTQRVLTGQKLYVRPSLAYVPFIYAPLYFYISAGVAKLIGLSFFTMRLVSFVSSLGCFALVYAIVQRETRSRLTAFTAVGLFAATFSISGSWFDIAREDSLFLLLVLVGAYLVRWYTSIAAYLLAAIVLWLAFLTKQSAVIILFPLLVFCAARDWKRSIAVAAPTIVLIAGSTVLLNRYFDGWYDYFLFVLPSEHTIAPKPVVTFWVIDLLLRAPALCLLSGAYLYATVIVRRLDIRHDPGLFYLLFAAGMVVEAWLSRVHRGGYDNVLMPAYAALAVLSALAIHAFNGAARRQSDDTHRIVARLTYAACVAQFLLLVYNPLREIPSKQDLQAGLAYAQRLSHVQGDVFIPYHPYVVALSGHRAYAHGMAVMDVLDSRDTQMRPVLLRELNQAVDDRQFGLVVLDSDYFLRYFDEFGANYQMSGPAFHDPAVFRAVVGSNTRPEVEYTPRGAADRAGGR